MNFVAKYVMPYLKGHFAALGAALAVAQADMAGNVQHDLGSLTGYQWIGIFVAAGILGGGVGALGNKPFSPSPAAPATPVVVDVPAVVDGAQDVVNA